MRLARADITVPREDADSFRKTYRPFIAFEVQRTPWSDVVFTLVRKDETKSFPANLREMVEG